MLVGILMLGGGIVLLARSTGPDYRSMPTVIQPAQPTRSA
jgi:hypothetical protein